jgi:CRP-like cAMP-binding protein
LENNLLNANYILAALSETGQNALKGELVSLPNGEILQRKGEPISRVYFPLTGIISLIQTAADGLVIEAGVVGKEGMAGIGAILEAETSVTESLVQTSGEAYVVSTEVLKKCAQQNSNLMSYLLRFTNVLLVQATVSVLCNRYHSVEQRLARWLLTVHDRVKCDELQLTQEFMSYMTGTSRSTATETVGKLAACKLIEPRYGRIFISDRERLEKTACECYRDVKREYDRFLSHK